MRSNIANIFQLLVEAKLSLKVAFLKLKFWNEILFKFLF